MFTCKYCSTEFIEHKPNCPNCGAQIKISESCAEKIGPKSNGIYIIGHTNLKEF